MPIEVFGEEALMHLQDVHELVPAATNATGFQPRSVHHATAMKAAALMEQLQVVTDPVGVGAIKMNWNESLKVREDVNFVPRGRYEQFLLFQQDGITPRKRPVRPVAQNEIGMLYKGPYRLNDSRRERDQANWHICYLADAGPGDLGEGQYFVVPVNAPVPDKTQGVEGNDNEG